MRLKIILGSIVVVAILIVVAGCGSSDSSSSDGTNPGDGSATTREGASTSEETSTTADGETTGGDGSESSGPMSKKAYQKKSAEICGAVPVKYGELQRELEKEFKQQGKKKPSTEEVNLKAAVPPLYIAVEQFEELTPPKGDEQEIEAIISSLEAAAKGLEEKPNSPLSGPESPFAEFQKLSGEYGMGGCSQL